MGVAIALVIAHLRHQLSRGIAQIERYLKGGQLARVRTRLRKSSVEVIALGRQGHIDRGFGNSALALGLTYAGKDVPSVKAYLHRLRVS